MPHTEEKVNYCDLYLHLIFTFNLHLMLVGEKLLNLRLAFSPLMSYQVKSLFIYFWLLFTQWIQLVLPISSWVCHQGMRHGQPLEKIYSHPLDPSTAPQLQMGSWEPFPSPCWKFLLS